MLVKLFRIAAAAAALVVMVGASIGAQAPQPPPTVTPFGSAPLPLAGQATRVGYVGLVEIYRIGVYVDGSLRDREHLVSPDTGKALRIDVTYKDDLYHRITFDWKRELIPPMDPAATVQLFGAFAPLTYGDVVSIEYIPRRGTAIYVDKASVVTSGSHDLMLTFLEHWLGQHPVSEEIKRSLLGS